jgi:hypothetical protein
VPSSATTSGGADTDADYDGTVNIEGTEYLLNGWLKTSKAGDKYISLSVRPKETGKAQTYASRRDDADGMAHPRPGRRSD